MTKKSLVKDAKNTLTDAAKVGAEGVKMVGSEALGAAAAAAAEVVLKRASQALGAGQQKVEEAIPPLRGPSVERKKKTKTKAATSRRKTPHAAKPRSEKKKKTARKAPAKKKKTKKAAKNRPATARRR